MGTRRSPSARRTAGISFGIGLAVMALGSSVVAAPVQRPVAASSSAVVPEGSTEVGGSVRPWSDVRAALAADASPHRYSDPVWYPLRRSAWVSCARTNCVKDGGRHYHDYWAQDWTGSLDRDGSGNWLEVHPVYAAGAGQVHVDRVDETCGASVAGGERTGTIVSIDHGGGVHSVYKHLDIDVVEGQWVTPRTRLGSMNAWGSKSCAQSYLHFEIHAGGRRGDFQPFNDMLACRNGDTRVWPDDMEPYDPDPSDHRVPAAYETWDDVTPYSTVTPSKRGPLAVPAGDSTCIPTSFGTPDAPAAPRATSTIDSLVVTLPAAPEDARQTIVSTQLFRPSSGAWADPVIEVVDPATSTHVVGGLDIGRTYRVRVAHRNRVGASEWSAPVDVMVGGVPQAPQVPRTLKYGRTWIALSWYRSERVGFPILGYDVAIRGQVRGVWQRWTVTALGNDSYLRWEGRRAGTPHQIRVRARTQAGVSAWSTVVSLTTQR